MKAVVRLACLVAVLSFATAAYAQDVTFVSTQGSDGTNCLFNTPCRTLFRGITQVQAGGTVVVLDSGVFGANVEIDKSVTIDATGVSATFIAMDKGIVVNGTNIAVTLRNLNIDVRPGLVGIHFVSGATVIAEDVKIRNGASPNGAGILMEGTAGAMTLRNVSIANYGNGTTAGAVVVDTSTGSRSLTVENSLLSRNSRGIVLKGAGNAKLSISNTTITNSTGNGIEMNSGGGLTNLTITDSKVVNNGGYGLMLYPTGAAKTNTTVTGSTFDGNVIGIRSFPASPAVSNLSISDTSASNNAGGVHAFGKSTVGIIRGNVSGNSSYGVTAVSPAAVRIGSSMVNGNTLGLSGPVSSYGNNQLLGNTTQGSSTPVAPGSMP